MALEGSVKVPGIGPVKKQTALYGGVGAVVLVLGIWWYRKRKAAAAAAAAPAAVDTAAQQPLGGAVQIWRPGSGQPEIPRPGHFADNAEWAPYAEHYMVTTLHADPGTVAAAIGKYLDGQPVTPGERTIVEEAIAIAGRPPGHGAGGYPPGIRLEPGPHPHPKPHPKVTVPAVTGERFEAAVDALQANDLGYAAGHREPGMPYRVTAQNPRAGAKAAPETIVHLTLREGK